MNLSNFLSVAISTMGVFENVVKIDWLGNIIKALIEGCGNIGLGIIVFTLILKLITLPFDIFSRVSTRKNSLKMEQMRPELEKLQKTYSRNQELYSQKMQELYKKNGYSPFASCLPTLLNLIVFFIVIGQFSTYSNYANFEVFCDMSRAYQTAIVNYDEINGTDYIFINENGEMFLDLNYFYNNETQFNLKSNFGFITSTSEENGVKSTSFSYENTNANIQKLANEIENGSNVKYKERWSIGEDGQIYLDTNTNTYKIIVENCGQDEEGNYVYSSEDEVLTAMCTDLVKCYANDFIDLVIKESAREASANQFRAHDLKFLWVKNIWCQDLPWEHPIKDTFGAYSFVTESGCGASCKASCNKVDLSINTVSEEQYAELTANLEEEKNTPNGYLILVILSIGIMLLSQIIMQNMNKAQTELSSVDGENGTAAQSQKMMTWMMPIMFGVFSFMYTASFSIYIIISSAFSLLSTLIINYFVEKRFEKIVAEEARKMELKRLGKLKELEELNKKNKKNKK